MSADPGAGAPSGAQDDPQARYFVDAHEAGAVQVGEGNVQINYTYDGGLTWTDGVAPPPLISRSGRVDSPYRGLSAFEEWDAAFFFGRETAATELLRRMSQRLGGAGLLVVSGVSGVGKSSLLRAGVLPRLRGAGLAATPGSAGWPCLVFTPTRTPLDEFAVRVASLAGQDAAAARHRLATDPAGFALTVRQAALTAAAGDRVPLGPRLVLVIDQFEQLFTQCSDEQQRHAFVSALHAATAGPGAGQPPAALAVLVVRADFEARCADYPELAPAVQDRYLVTPMTERQLLMAITAPAKEAGSRIEDDLVTTLLSEIGSHPGAPSPARLGPGQVSRAGVLPLLSHALDQAWRRRAGESVTLGDYERTGGIEGAVADSAQRVYENLTGSQQAAARQVFTRLTATSSDGIDVADRASQADLLDGKSPDETRDVAAVLEGFAGARLLTLAAGTVEISHEVLLTAWPLLRDEWLADTHADRIVRTRLRNTAEEWARHSRDQSYLYAGTLLAAAADAAARTATDPARRPPLSQNESDFLHASTRSGQRRARRRRSVIALLTALAVGFAAVVAVAVASGREAAQRLDVVVSGELVAESQGAAAADPRISDLEAVAAWRISRSSQAGNALLAAAARPSTAVLTDGPSEPANPVAFSPDGTILAAGSIRVRMWDMATRRPIAHPLTGNFAGSVAFSPNGQTLAIGGGSKDGSTGIVRRWDVATRRPAGHPLISHFGQVDSLAFSPHGGILAAGDGSGTVWLWNVTTGQQLGHLTYGHEYVTSVAFSRNGKTLAVAGGSGTELWAVTPRRLIGRLPAPAGGVSSVAFSADGHTLATGDDDGTVRLWDVATRHLAGRLADSQERVNSVAFSPNGQILAAGASDGTVRLWDTATHRQTGLLTASTGGVVSVAFSAHGQTLAAGNDNGTVQLWSLAEYLPTGLLSAHTGGVRSVAFSPNGHILATGDRDGMVRLWNVATRQQAGRLDTGQRPVDSVAFSPVGETLATGSHDGAVQLWNAAADRLIGDLPTGTTSPVDSVAFSPDGKTLAASDQAGVVRLWAVATRRRTGRFKAPPDGVISVAFSRRGQTLAIGGSGDADLFTGIDQVGIVQLWDIPSRHQIGRFTASAGGFTAVVFSPDGKILATGDGDGTVRLWDVANRRQVGGPLTGPGPVSSVAFSPNGKTLAVGDTTGTTQLWDAATGQQIGRPFTAPGPVSSVAFSPNGKTLAVGDTTGTTQLWDVSYLTDTLRRVCYLAGGSFTRAEWTQHVPSGPAYRKICP
jgi:WD40 repeat protein